MLALVGYSQDRPYYFTHYQVENGLSNNAVLCSAQDGMGFIWFGTKDGLNRFDGYSFKAFHSDPDNSNGLGSNFIRALFVDQTDRIWVGTDQGIYIFNPKSETFSLFHLSITNEILHIQGDRAGNVWFIDNRTLYRYAAKADQLTPITDVQSQASSFGIAASGDLWIGTVNGELIQYHPTQGTKGRYALFDHSPRVVSQRIENVYCSDRGILLVGTTKQGVKAFDTGTGTYRDLLTHDEYGTDIFVRDIIENKKDEYWFATESGIFIYHYGTGQCTNLRKQRGNPWALSDNAVYTFCKDKEHGIWAGTYFGGINHYALDNAFFEKFFPLGDDTNTISGNAVREICADERGDLWIGTEDAGLNKMDISTGRMTSYQPTSNAHGLAYSNIHGLLLTGDTLWVGTFQHGLDLLNVNTSKVMRHYDAEGKDGTLQNNFIFNIYRTSNGRILLATGRGLYEYVWATQRFRIVREFPAHIFYTTLFEDSNGTIWAGTWRDGLYYARPETGEKGSFSHHVHIANSLSSNRVNRIYEDSRGTIWVATEGGLCRLDAPGSFRRYGTRQGMPSNLILTILEDNDGRLWVTTSKGLVRFDTATGEINVFTQANGLLSDQFNYNSAYKSPDGTLYFGSVKGLVKFNPANYRESTFQPPVYITGLQVYNHELEISKKGSPLLQSITFTDHIELNHNQSSFSIDFAALSFVSPGMTEYAYKMEGLDKAWTHIRTNRKVYFTELPPGDYLFRVNVAGSHGGFIGKETQLRISILPPFWASQPAYVLYILLVSATAWYAIRSYHRRVREKNKRKLELIRHRKEEELYRAKIDFFTNVTHEIRTPLTLIKAPLEKVMKKAEELPTVKRHLQTMERNTERLLELTNQLLDFRKAEVTGYQLRFMPLDINRLLRESLLGFKLLTAPKNIRLRYTLPDTPCIATVDKEAVTQIISNLLGNALKYAKRHIEVALLVCASDDRVCTISVKNDGYLIPADMREKIFETFVRLKATETQQGVGLGLALARSLAQLHKGNLQLAIPENGMNVFILTLPLEQQFQQPCYGAGITKD
ncbi:two-component regulator propeller domain-containing protein [Parapedobacter koreensis]|uniref:two-component regulator propeller domain-containing protein n=1 Tax=Parapedobacter koreensis TaxID=332977 RepID=UPI000B83410F|nr:two-component regulator propeller domain-containing protein [Parapedobacter koreensis]